MHSSKNIWNFKTKLPWVGVFANFIINVAGWQQNRIYSPAKRWFVNVILNYLYSQLCLNCLPSNKFSLFPYIYYNYCRLGVLPDITMLYNNIVVAAFANYISLTYVSTAQWWCFFVCVISQQCSFKALWWWTTLTFIEIFITTYSSNIRRWKVVD